MLQHDGKPVDTIFVHCAATRPKWWADKPAQAKTDEIRRWHVEDNGWRDIGYHYVIDRDGTVTEGRPLGDIGAHVFGHNTGSIGICLMGGHGSNENDRFHDHFTSAQDEALRTLIEELKEEAPIKYVRGHNEVAAKACPGFKVSRWLERKNPKRKASESRTVQGGTAAATGGVGAALSEQAEQIEPLVGVSDVLLYIFVALILAGAGYAIYARLDDWKAGRE